MTDDGCTHLLCQSEFLVIPCPLRGWSVRQWKDAIVSVSAEKDWFTVEQKGHATRAEAAEPKALVDFGQHMPGLVMNRYGHHIELGCFQIPEHKRFSRHARRNIECTIRAGNGSAPCDHAVVASCTDFEGCTVAWFGL